MHIEKHYMLRNWNQSGGIVRLQFKDYYYYLGLINQWTQFLVFYHTLLIICLHSYDFNNLALLYALAIKVLNPFKTRFLKLRRMFPSILKYRNGFKADIMVTVANEIVTSQ